MTGLWLTPRPTEFLTLLVVLSLCSPSAALGPLTAGLGRLEAQETPKGHVQNRFFITTFFASAGPGPGEDFEGGLRRAGYGDPYSREGRKPRFYPRSHPGWGGIEFALGYEHSSKAGVVVSAGVARLGETDGFRSIPDQGDAGDFVSFHHSIRHLSPALSYRIGPARAFLGPTFVEIRTHLENGLTGPQKRHGTEIGAAGGLGFAAPIFLPTLNLELSAQYRFLGTPEIDHFSLKEGIVEKFNANFNHWQISAGLGLRFSYPALRASDTLPPSILTGPIAPSAVKAGIQAAQSRFTFGYAAGSFLGGAAVGLWGWYFDQDDCRAFTLGGVAIIGVTTLVSHLSSKRIPEAVAAEVEIQGPEYERVFRDEYRKELRKRHRRRIIIGGLSGIVAGVGILALALGGGA